MRKLVGSLTLLPACLALIASTSAHSQDQTEIEALWDQYTNACNHAGTSLPEAIDAAGWSRFEPSAESYIGQILASTEQAMQITRDAGELPQDFDPPMQIQAFRKKQNESSIFLMFIRMPTPDDSGRVLYGCDLIAPDSKAQFTQVEVDALGRRPSTDQSSSMMVKFRWTPGLQPNQLWTEIARILPLGTTTLESFGLVAARGIIIKSQTLEGPN